MKTRVKSFLRFLLAAAGVAVILIWLISWHDYVVFPEGYPLSGGEVLDEMVALRITEVRRSDDGVIYHLEPGFQLDRITDDDLGYRVDLPRYQPGIITMLKSADLGLLLLGVVLVAVIFPVQTVRWQILMRCRGLEVPWLKAFRLTMVGQFFNICMPGTTGGDVVRAYYAAKGSGRKSAAVMSVIFDRITGLLGLVLLGGLMGLAILDEPRTREITILVWIGLGGVTAFSALYFSEHLRRRFHIEYWLAKLPGRNLLLKIHEAAAAYGKHKTSVTLSILISLPVHLCLTGATAMAGYAMGLDLPLLMLLTIIPVLMLVASIPVMPQGVLIMEGLALLLLADPLHASANQIIAMLLMLRVFMIVYALLGSLVLIRGDIHLFPQDIDMGNISNSDLPT